jgi:hypothetical protein
MSEALSGIFDSKKEFQVEKNEPMLQIEQAIPIVIAEIRSVMTGALNAITAERRPTMLKPIRSIKMLGVGKTKRVIR